MAESLWREAEGAPLCSPSTPGRREGNAISQAPHVLVVIGDADAAAAARGELGGTWHVEHARDAAAVVSAVPEADAILDASLQVALDEETLRWAARLRYVALAATGTDHIDLEHLRQRGIRFKSLHDRRDVLQDVTAAAEHSFALLLACLRRLPAAAASVEAGGWDRTRFPGRVLRGKTLGIVGCGRNGRWMAQYARAFGLRVLGFDPYAGDLLEAIERVQTLDELLGRSDIVALHVTLNAETQDLLGEAEFAQMRPGAVLVNTSRGALVDEEAMLDALRSGHLSGCGLDVVRHEPPPPSDPLIAYAADHPEVVITPHIGGFCPEVLLGLVATLARDIADHFAVPT